MTRIPGSALLLPAQGHAPNLIGAGLLREVAADTCIPAYYGEDQRRILRDTFPAETGRIFLSQSLGRLIEPLLVGRKTFSKRPLVSNVDVYASDVQKYTEGISTGLEASLRNGIEAVSLDGARKHFTRFDLALNLGLPVHSPVQPVFFAFASKMSEIYRLSPYQSAGVAFLARLWKEIEASFRGMFIPRLHSLCHQNQFDGTGITFTPPFAQPEPVNVDDAIPPAASLVVVSGTGMEVRKLLQLVRSSPGPWVTLPESPETLPQERVPRTSPRAWGHPNVHALVARSGLGSIWQAVANQKPIGVVKPAANVDPEVYHNARMVEALGIGTVLEQNLEPLLQALPRFRCALQEQVRLDIEMFETLDGIRFTAGALQRALANGAPHLSLVNEGVNQNEPILAG